MLAFWALVQWNELSWQKKEENLYGELVFIDYVEEKIVGPIIYQIGHTANLIE